jgi:RimJ/RimL family protein N-acetyltransferase
MQQKCLGIARENPYIAFMTANNEWLQAALDTADPDPCGPLGGRRPGGAKHLMVPIRSLGPSNRERIAAHLQALDAGDRYLRFGYPASDEQIRRYVDQLDFDRDDIFGIYNRRLDLIAMAHLAYTPLPEHANCAEFGVSVARSARGRGYGARLFDRAVMHARNAGVHMVFIHALTENTAMLRIARNAGALVQRDGSESEAFLELPSPSLDSRMAEMVEQQYGEVDYQLKRQAQQFWAFLASVRGMGDGVREGVRKALGASDQ